MRRICTGLLAAALAIGLLAAQPAQAKVYKMDPEERAAALKEKKAKRAKARKSGKAAAEPGQGQGGWVEVKPGEKIAKKSRKPKADQAAPAAEKKGVKSRRAKAAEQPAEHKAEKKAEKKPEKKVDKKAARKHEKPEAKPEGKSEAKPEAKAARKTAKKAEPTAEKRTGKKGRRSASRGDRAVGSGYAGEHKVSASSTEVRRPADDLGAYSVSRPGQAKAAPAAPAAPAPAVVPGAAPAAPPAATPVVPEVRKEVQPGPLDTSTPVGTEQKAGEGRF